MTSAAKTPFLYPLRTKGRHEWGPRGLAATFPLAGAKKTPLMRVSLACAASVRCSLNPIPVIGKRE